MLSKETYNKDDQQKIIEVVQLFKKFAGKQVLNGFDIDLYNGECLVVIGKSGSGKTVMIRCMVGLMTGESGQIKILDKSIPDLDQKELDELRLHIGFLFQGSALYDSMSVRENLEFPLRRLRKKYSNKDAVEKLIREVLVSVGLEHTIDLMPSELSGGMKRRIALARTLILRPEIIFYDEPTTGLDPITAKEIINLIAEVQKKYNTTSLIITHDLNVAKLISNRVVILVDGKNYAEGTYQEMVNSSDPVIKAFF
ncbi:ABC transporter ATP-binding protein [Plebeiibacterium sediminum]|uniref:ATP-binding cassette domain-containing protein n=1 Tax=Plebeiibacterium sediminum TaxID=2992112 RepID=A0AAE3M452_9BACT|nr:ATP-binding cassette domain-containing protein [Plebeiobacterium sediminum]MCW3786455.1 ATP-binding cassette domain-containing protein [Plebeiobacterium sediminum]